MLHNSLNDNIEIKVFKRNSYDNAIDNIIDNSYN